MVGENVTLNCSVALPDGRFDTPTFTWIGPSLEADSTQTFNESLILRNIQPLEAGPYTCDASLGGSIVTTKTVRVHSECNVLCQHEIPYIFKFQSQHQFQQ